MYLSIYEERIDELENTINFLERQIGYLEKQVEDQAELIYTLKKTYYGYKPIEDDPNGEASDFYND